MEVIADNCTVLGNKRIYTSGSLRTICVIRGTGQLGSLTLGHLGYTLIPSYKKISGFYVEILLTVIPLIYIRNRIKPEYIIFRITNYLLVYNKQNYQNSHTSTINR